MILQALFELARDEHLIGDYELARVDLVVELDLSGRPVGPAIELEKGTKRRLPRQREHTNAVEAKALLDNSKYALGVGTGNPERLIECFMAFSALQREILLRADDDGLKALVRFLDLIDPSSPARQDVLDGLGDREWTGSEVVAFRLSGDEYLLSERTVLREWWSTNRNSAPASSNFSRCLVTGRVCQPQETHPKLKRVPGSTSSGAPLVSFNLSPFWSHALKQSLNAPVSREGAEGYSAAANWLLEGTSGRIHRNGVKLAEDTVMLFWTKVRPEETFASIFSILDGPPKDADARPTFESIWKGTEAADIDDTAFYALTLSGAAGRVVVRDWFTDTFGRVKQHLRQWFDDLRIGNDPQPVPLKSMLGALAPPGSSAALPPNLGTRLFQAALRGGAIPPELLVHALRRFALKDSKKERRELEQLAALIKVSLIRSSSGRSKEGITVTLNKENSEPAYLLGRLFAAIERLQGVALGDVGASIRDKYFSAASATPAAVFPRLLQVSMHHAAKADRKGFWLEKRKQEIISLLPGDRIPKVLPLEDRGLFAIGYYHEREDLWRKREDAELSLTE